MQRNAASRAEREAAGEFRITPIPYRRWPLRRLRSQQIMDRMAAILNSEESLRNLYNRRNAPRYPIHEVVEYRVGRKRAALRGTGKTVDISSSGMLFTAQHRLPVGQMVEVAVNWPVLLDGVCGLKLVAAGVVIRANEEAVAVRISRYEFRTRATRPTLTQP